MGSDSTQRAPVIILSGAAVGVHVANSVVWESRTYCISVPVHCLGRRPLVSVCMLPPPGFLASVHSARTPPPPALAEPQDSKEAGLRCHNLETESETGEKERECTVYERQKKRVNAD